MCLLAALLVLCSMTVHAQMSIGAGYEYLGDTYGGVLSSSLDAPWQSFYGGMEGWWRRGWMNVSLDARMLKLLLKRAVNDELPGFGIGLQGSAYMGVWFLGRDLVPTWERIGESVSRPTSGSAPPTGIAASANLGMFLDLDVFIMPLPWFGMGFGPSADLLLLIRLGGHVGIRLEGGVQYDVGRWVARGVTSGGILRDGLIQPFGAAGVVLF